MPGIRSCNLRIWSPQRYPHGHSGLWEALFRCCTCSKWSFELAYVLMELLEARHKNIPIWLLQMDASFAFPGLKAFKSLSSPLGWFIPYQMIVDISSYSFYFNSYPNSYPRIQVNGLIHLWILLQPLCAYWLRLQSIPTDISSRPKALSLHMTFIAPNGDIYSGVAHLKTKSVLHIQQFRMHLPTFW